MSGERFDPGPHVRTVRRDGQVVSHLDIKWRVVWLRREHPDAQIATEHIQLTDEQAIFKAQVVVPGRGSASGYGVARRAENPDYVERAETRAIGRALLVLGFGTDYSEEFVLDAEVRPDGAPTQLPPGVTVGPSGSTVLPPRLAAALANATPIAEPVAAALPAREDASPAPSEVEPVASDDPSEARREAEQPGKAVPLVPRGQLRRPVQPRPIAPAAGTDVTGDEPAVETVVRHGRGVRPGGASAGPPARPSEPRATEQAALTGGPRPRALQETPPGMPQIGARRSLPAADQTEPVLDDDQAADHDWTAFWRWARRQGYNNRDEIQQAIGQPIKGRTPKELRTLIMNLNE